MMRGEFDDVWEQSTVACLWKFSFSQERFLRSYNRLQERVAALWLAAHGLSMQRINAEPIGSGSAGRPLVFSRERQSVTGAPAGTILAREGEAHRAFEHDAGGTASPSLLTCSRSFRVRLHVSLGTAQGFQP